MFPRKILAFDSGENMNWKFICLIEIRITWSCKEFSKTQSQISKTYFRKGNKKFKGQATAPATFSRGTSAAGAVPNPDTILSPGHTRTREGDGSPVSRAAAAAAAVDEVAAAGAAVVDDEAALPVTITEASLPCAWSCCAQSAFDTLVYIQSFF